MQTTDTTCPACGATGALVRSGAVHRTQPIGLVTTTAAGEPDSHEVRALADWRMGDAEGEQLLSCTECWAEWGDDDALVAAMTKPKRGGRPR